MKPMHGLFFKLFQILISVSLAFSPLHMSFANDLPTLNYRGEDGEKAQNGRTYEGQQARDERNGRNAGDALPPTDATDGADLELNLTQDQSGFAAHLGMFTLSGKAYWPDSRKAQDINPIRVQFDNTSGYIDVITDGGDGQMGGIGGTGEQGGDGIDGEDLPWFGRTIQVRRDPGYNPFSSWNFGGSLFNGGSLLRRGPFGLRMPEPGTDSGDGGDAGAGTHGSNSANGGDIKFKVNWASTHLLTLFNLSQKPGEPGPPGEHGLAGEAGEPGKGGEGGWVTFEWEEKVKKTDDEGNTYWDYEEESRRVRVPDAEDGERGRKGDRPQHRLRAGKPADVGQLSIEVTEKDGSVSVYSSVFDLVLSDYNIVSNNDDLIFEPGEGGYIENITVYNPSDMPTPENVNILVYLNDGKYIFTEAIPLKIKNSIPGKTSVTLKAKIPFTVRNNLLTTPKAEPAQWGDRVRLVSEMESTQRPFREFHSGDSLTIRYPIKIEQISALNSIGPGEATKFWLKITNISGRDFTGANGIRRDVESLIKRTSGDLGEDDLELFDENGNPLDLTGWVKDISQLKDQDSLYIKAIVGAARDAEASRSAKIQINLAIQNIAEPQQMDVIQAPSLEFRVNQAYKKTKDSDFLLIINSETPKEAVDAWKALAAKLHGKIDIWDISREAHLELTKELINGSKLLDDFRGKTMIMLNNPFEVAGIAMKSEDQLRKRDFLKAVTERDINFYMAGGQDSADLSNFMLTPGFNGNYSEDFESIDSFLDRFSVGKLPDQQAEFEGLDYTDVFSNLKVNHFSFWGQPKEAWLENQSEKVRKKLQARRPTSRYFTVTRFKPELIKKTWFYKKWKMGEIQVARSTDTSVGSGVFLKTDKSQLNNPDFILGLENITALVLGLTPKEILERINKFISGKAQFDEITQKALLNGLLVYLAKEQGDLRYHVWKGELSAFKIQQEMDVLSRLTRSIEALPKNANKAQADMVVNLIGAMKFLSSAQRTFWDYVLPARNNRDVSKVTNSMLDAIYKKAFSVEGRWVFKKSQHGFDLGQINQQIRGVKTQLYSQLDEKGSKGEQRREDARSIFTKIVESLSLGRDQFNSPEERQLNADDVDQMSGDEEARRAKAEELSKTVDGKINDLLVPHPRYSTNGLAPVSCQSLF